MSSEEHLLLSSFIKKIHKDLRTTAETQGVEKAWSNHCKNENALQEYAQCMKRLATEHWDKKHKGDIKNSRNAWIIHQARTYFENEIYLAKRQKELTEKEKNHLMCSVKTSQFQTPYKLLDVGSCYNPFKNVENIETTAIDIGPASSDVYKCDFTSLNLTDLNEPMDSIISKNSCPPIQKNSSNSVINTKSKGEHNQDRSYDVDETLDCNVISSMCKESFDIVVFSLLLEYMPCSKLRFQCCVKAYHLLKYEGILIIITPDSKHQTSSNVQIMKQWKQTLQVIGFKRIKYEKLTHIHCMVFRKSCLVNQINEDILSLGELLIPQDSNETKSEGVVLNTPGERGEDECVAQDFTLLPSQS
ncbi:hypothetical protein M8J77_009117 [Diaphorina citri]|nr:hypothetical protein M8J77_009117 [Diaphorina citri]